MRTTHWPIVPSIGGSMRNIIRKSLELLTLSCFYWTLCSLWPIMPSIGVSVRNIQIRPLNHSLTFPQLNPVYSLTTSSPMTTHPEAHLPDPNLSFQKITLCTSPTVNQQEKSAFGADSHGFTVLQFRQDFACCSVWLSCGTGSEGGASSSKPQAGRRADLHR